MDPVHKNKILRNADFIAQNICSVTVVLNRLLGNSVLEPSEVDQIRSKSTDYEAGTALCYILVRKDSSVFPHVIDCFDNSGNKAIAKKLQEPPESSTSTDPKLVKTTDSPVTPIRVNEMDIDSQEVVDILSKDFLFCKKWKLFCKALNFSAATINSLEKKETLSGIEDALMDIMNHWKGIDGSAANITELVKKLRGVGCVNCAEMIEKL